MKKIFFLLISIILVLGVSGCMKRIDKTENEKLAMLSFLEQKYSEEFEFVNINTQVWSADYIEMIVESKNYPGTSIIVQKNNISGEILDNYISIMLNADIEQEISNIVANIYGESKAFNAPKRKVLPSTISKDISVSELFATVPYVSDLKIFVTKETDDKDKDLNKLVSLIRDKKYPLTFSVCYVANEDFQEINHDNYTDLLTKNSSKLILCGDFVMGENLELTYRNWR